MTTMLLGLGLGLLKGMFLAEILKKPSKTKGYGYGHHDEHKQRLAHDYPVAEDLYSRYKYRDNFQTPY